MRASSIGIVGGMGVLVLCASIGGSGCGSSTSRAFDPAEPAPTTTSDDGGTTPPSPDASFGGDDDGGGGNGGLCQGLQCQQKTCANGGDTTVTGKVYAPNGTLPLYNAIVYVPNTTPSALPKGATCDTCGAVTGNPVASAITDATGTFTLKNVPVGTDIPLVVQIGKWRRQVKIAKVEECTKNELTDPELTRLPKTQAEGDMPHIALTTGGCDNVGCMLPKLGIDPSEFGVASDGPSKAVHTYVPTSAGGPKAAAKAEELWRDASKLKQYDLVILSCECGENTSNKGDVAYAAMTDYLKAGGRIFTTDFMYLWYKYSPDAALSSVASIPGGAPLGGSPMTLDSSFPKGKALVDWLAATSGIKSGQIKPDNMYANFGSVDQSKAQIWASSGAGPLYPLPGVGKAGPRVMTVNVPVGAPAENQCGRAVHIDAHANSTSDYDMVGNEFPKGCGQKPREAESLLSFFFFDLASCIQNDAEPPKPPVVK